MMETQEQSWVWRSTNASRTAGQVSVLAVVETLICVAGYWLLVMWFGVMWHHWLILISAPLMLLRSEQSVALGLKWFDAVLDRDKTAQPALLRVGILIFSVLTSVLGIWFLDDIFLARATDLFSFIKMIISALCIALILPIAFVIVQPAVAIRLAATTRFLLPGLRQFPENWRFLIAKSDIFHPAELMPGDDEYAYGDGLSFSLRDADDNKISASDLIINYISILTFFSPALLWRWSLKSTAWFYLPLLWVGRGWQNLDDEELLIWGRSYCAKAINRAGLIVVGFALLGSLLSLLAPAEFLRLQQMLAESGAPITPFGYLMVLNWSALGDQPWLWAYLPSYALTIMVFFMLDSASKEIAHGAPLASRMGRFRILMWAGNARSLLTNIGLVVALWYFLNAVDAWQKIGVFWALVSAIMFDFAR